MFVLQDDRKNQGGNGRGLILKPDMKLISISKQTLRRFVLGRQGLWPGRRWKGRKGVIQAITECEAVQEDPLVVVARSHDIVLFSRVVDYKPQHLTQVMYKERKFFDYGGGLFIYPMSELPFWRVHMEKRAHGKRVEDFVFTHGGLFEAMREEIRQRGPLGNRDVDGKAVSWNYRGRKESSLALFDMWLSGELMIHHRERFERIYDFRENIAPPELDYTASENEAQEYFARKVIAFKGIIPPNRWGTELGYYLRRKIDRQETKARVEHWIETGRAAFVKVEGSRENQLVLGEDLPALEQIAKGKIPRSWKPIDSSTDEEVNFLAPLDIVSARGRAGKLFDFEYLWEVYKPAHQRRWGYYTLPILYGDALVARLDPRLDRENACLKIMGFWHEEDAPIKDQAFAGALGRGLIRFAGFLEAQRIDISTIRPPGLRKEVGRVIRNGSELAVQ